MIIFHFGTAKVKNNFLSTRKLFLFFPAQIAAKSIQKNNDFLFAGCKGKYFFLTQGDFFDFMQ